MAKRALITGAAGFVGHSVLTYLMDKTDWEFIAVDSFRHKGDSLRIQHMAQNPRITVYYHDLGEKFSDVAVKSFGDVDYILNIASDSHVDRSIDDPVPFVKNNVAIALTMGELAREIKPEIFLQMGTDEVFGPALNGQFHKEWDIHKPSNPYAASKSAQDQILYSYWRCYDVPVVFTHTMNIFGPRQDAEKFIPMLISKISSGEKITIHGTENEVGSRMYLHVYNLADAWMFICNHMEAVRYKDNHHIDQYPLSFNVTGQEEIDNLELAKMVADIIGKPLNFEFLDFHSARPGHDRRYALDGQAIKDKGWKHPYSLRESLEQTVQWTLSDGKWL